MESQLGWLPYEVMKMSYAPSFSAPGDHILDVVCQSYTQRQYQQAQHKTQGKRKTGNWKIDYERRRDERKTLLNFPSPKSLNYYW